MADDFKAFWQLGQRIGVRGYNTETPIDDLVREHMDKWPLYQSAAIVRALGDILAELKAIKYVARGVDDRDREARRARPPSPSHPVADGLLSVLAGVKAGRVGDQDFESLSVRARKTLKQLADVPLTDLTEGMLRDVRNCGWATALEILAWRDRGGAK